MLPVTIYDKTQISKGGYSQRVKQPSSILIHSTNGKKDTSFSGELGFLLRSESVGADYLVGETEIAQLLDSSKYYAWGAGDVNDQWFSNQNTINVEVHYSPNDTKPVSPNKLQNLYDLVISLMQRFTIPVSSIAMHRTVASPKGRKVDPSFWTDAQFAEWKKTLNTLTSYMTLQECFIYSDTDLTTIARHIKTPIIKDGVLPVGSTFNGKQVNDKAVWMSSGYGFVPLWAFETDTILNGEQVDPTLLYRALNKFAPSLSQEDKDSLVAAYTALGQITTIGNIRPFAQAAKETAWFTSPRFVESFNPAGLGATNDGAWGSTFDTIASGVLAQYCHLLCYATKPESTSYLLERLAQLSPRVDAMTKEHGRGSAITWGMLNGKWAFPGDQYGETILLIADAIKKL